MTGEGVLTGDVLIEMNRGWADGMGFQKSVMIDNPLVLLYGFCAAGLRV